MSAFAFSPFNNSSPHHGEEAEAHSILRGQGFVWCSLAPTLGGVPSTHDEAHLLSICPTFEKPCVCEWSEIYHSIPLCEWDIVCPLYQNDLLFIDTLQPPMVLQNKTNKKWNLGISE